MLQMLAAKVLAMSAPFDAGRSAHASARCKAHVRRYLSALGVFDMWAIGSEYCTPTTTDIQIDSIAFVLMFGRENRLLLLRIPID